MLGIQMSAVPAASTLDAIADDSSQEATDPRPPECKLLEQKTVLDLSAIYIKNLHVATLMYATWCICAARCSHFLAHDIDGCTAGGHEQMDALDLVEKFEHIHTLHMQAWPAAGLQAPQLSARRWAEIEVADLLPKYLQMRNSNRLPALAPDWLRFLRHLRQAYHQIHGPTATSTVCVVAGEAGASAAASTTRPFAPKAFGTSVIAEGSNLSKVSTVITPPANSPQGIEPSEHATAGIEGQENAKQAEVEAPTSSQALSARPHPGTIGSQMSEEQQTSADNAPGAVSTPAESDSVELQLLNPLIAHLIMLPCGPSSCSLCPAGSIW